MRPKERCLKMDEKIKEVLQKVLEAIKPRNEEYERVWRVIEKLSSSLEKEAEKIGLEIKVEVEGSIAKDTWLAGARDVDIFLLFPKETPENLLRKYGLTIARRAVERVGGEYYETYAYHPYIRGLIEGYEIDIVPAYKMEKGEPLTPVDRTPFHTRYVLEHLSPEMKDEVRLLKQFMKGVGVYGAEIKVGGFSGYLCELLIIHYRNFIETLRHASRWIPWRTIIDIEGYYKGVPNSKLRRMLGFGSPLIVVDPIDKKRNVAAAVTLQKFSEFKAASRLFLDKPSTEFFFPKPTSPLKPRELREIISKRGSCLVAILLPCPKLPPDILWGEIYRSLRGLRKLLEDEGFKVNLSKVFSDERNFIFYFFELENCSLPPVVKHEGPPVGEEDRERRFLTKYLVEHRELVFSGPFIEGGKWIIYRKRRLLNVKEVLREKVNTARHGAHLRKIFSEGKFEIYVGEEISTVLTKYENSDLGTYISTWLKGTYPWLRVLADEG